MIPILQQLPHPETSPIPPSVDLQLQSQLFYVSQSHCLSSSRYRQNGEDDEGLWQPDTSLTNYTTAPNTRSLSVGHISNTNIDAVLAAFRNVGVALLF